MKRFAYYIVPILGLAVFTFFYYQHMDVVKANEVARQEEKAKALAEESAKKAEAQKKALADAQRRAAEREAEDKKKAEEKAQKHLKAVSDLEGRVKEHKDDFAKSLQLTKDNEAKLASLRAERESLRRSSFDLAKQIALKQIERRNAELEIQRFVDMVGRKADESSLTKLPPAPAPAK
jgi:transcription initiation factor IIF auxiliary subunit